MKHSEIKRAVAMMRIFIMRVSDLEKNEKYMFSDIGIGNCPKESAAVRRASMDVTRQLAVMRKS
jgi:hypothetical protein